MRRRSGFGLIAAQLLSLCASAVSACTTEVPNYTPDADTGSRHAVLKVERVQADSDDALTADAFAEFVRVPAHAEPSKVLTATGIVRGLPAVDVCWSGSDDFEEISSPASDLGPVEFLEAGDVVIRAKNTKTGLVAHAFPTVGDLVSGVVYATRDRSADPLPAAVPYTIETQGSATVGPMRVRGDAPAALQQVTVNGVPLFERHEVSLGEPLDLTWSVGDPSDVVYVELTVHDGGPTAVCVFRDDAGAGTIPAGLLGSGGSGSVSVHRARILTFDPAGFDTAELRFDFQQTATVDFVE